MNTNPVNSRNLSWIVMGLLLLTLGAWSALRAQEQPASAPAVAPATSQSAASQPAPSHDFLSVPIPEPVAKALEFSPKEMTGLDASTADSTNLLGDKGLSLLLKHISKIRTFNKEEFTSLEPGIVRLMRKHGLEDYRFYPIRLDLQVNGMAPFKPENWPKDNPVSMLLCTSMSTPGPDKNNPNIVIVLIAQDVKALLGTPDSWNQDGQFWEYKKNPQRLQIAGVYYRNFILSDVDKENSAKLVYPLVVAWQILDSNSAGPSTGMNDWQLLLVGGAIVLVFFLWLWVRRIAKGRNQAKLDRHRRQESQAEFVPRQEDIDQMDPALLAAAEAFFQEHPEKRPRSHNRPVSKTFDAAGEAVIEVDPALKEAAEQFYKDHRENGKRQS
jgi:hypothetical protein